MTEMGGILLLALHFLRFSGLLRGCSGVAIMNWGLNVVFSMIQRWKDEKLADRTVIDLPPRYH